MPTASTLFTRLCLAAFLFLTGCAAPPFGESTPSMPPLPAATTATLTFGDAVTLRNGHVELAVSPRVGRIVRFARTGAAEGENLLWLNTPDVHDHPTRLAGRTYFNLGGDKVWPTVQSLWERAYGGGGWPPGGVIDGQPWKLVAHTPRSVTIESRVDPALGVRVRRTIELADDAPRIQIINTLERIEPSVFPIHIWSVTQVRSPEAVLLDVAPDRVDPSRKWIDFGQGEALAPFLTPIAGDAAVLWRLGAAGDGRTGDAKLGTLGRWVAAIYDDTLFLQSATYDPHGAYPDASSVQVYTGGQYTELELLSPFVHLQPGQALEHRVTWRLLDRPAGATPAELHDLLTAAVNEPAP